MKRKNIWYGCAMRPNAGILVRDILVRDILVRGILVRGILVRGRIR